MLENDLDTCPIAIYEVVSHHENGCQPGIKQYIWCQTKAAGKYSNMSSLVRHHLVSYMVLKPNGFVEASFICSFMLNTIPYCKAIISQYVYNVQIHALMLMKQIKSESKTLDSFEFKPDVEKKRFTPLDEISDDFLAWSFFSRIKY